MTTLATKPAAPLLLPARVAGGTLLCYIAITLASMALSTQTTSVPAIALHPTQLRLLVVLSLLASLAALVLAVSLYALTRAVEPTVALLALACRLAEGITGAFVARELGLLWLATSESATVPDSGALRPLGDFLLQLGAWSPGASFFAVGSTLFAWLLLRGRLIPGALAGLGVLASALLVVLLPLELVGALGSPVSDLMWLPILVYEVVLALWLLLKGVATPRPGAGGAWPAAGLADQVP